LGRMGRDEGRMGRKPRRGAGRRANLAGQRFEHESLGDPARWSRVFVLETYSGRAAPVSASAIAAQLLAAAEIH
jgi:hypothetical protein